MPKVEMLYTGGLDSTYRLIQLSMMDGVEVQPYYVLGERKSRFMERDRVLKICEMLTNRETTKAKILEPIIVDKKTIVYDEELVNAYIEFYKYMKLGLQYTFLGSFAKDHPGLELSIEKDPNEEHAFAKKNIKLVPKETEIGTTWVVAEDTDKNAYTIFKNFTFPIATTTKKEEIDNMIAWGYEDIMKLTWFCHNPKRGKPCGYCAPCTQYMEAGLEFLFDKESKHRYKYRKIYGLPHRLSIKLSHIFGNKTKKF